jgi:hypothetical protein
MHRRDNDAGHSQALRVLDQTGDAAGGNALRRSQGGNGQQRKRGKAGSKSANPDNSPELMRE